jgi:predicted sugar kinase
VTDSAIAVSLTDTEFSLNELRQFIEKADSVDEMASDALVAVTHQSGAGPTVYTLTASTAFRAKG